MIIIRSGKKPTDPPKWWNGYCANCGTCGVQVRFENRDIPVSEISERRPNGLRIAKFICPTAIGDDSSRWLCPGVITITEKMKGL